MDADAARGQNVQIANPDKDMPGWVQGGLSGPRRVNTAYLYFDTNLNPRRRNKGLVPRCVRDYELLARVNGEWKTVHTETGNYHRRRSPRFGPVEANAPGAHGQPNGWCSRIAPL